jgi:hypothetical protein
VDLVGKGGHIRTLPIPERVKAALDQWTVAVAVIEGQIFRSFELSRGRERWGKGISQKILSEKAQIRDARDVETERSSASCSAALESSSLS